MRSATRVIPEPASGLVMRSKTSCRLGSSSLPVAAAAAAVEAAAAALVQRYGEDAEVIATLRAAEFAAEGDTEALHAWDMIIAQLVAQREGASSLPNATIN